MAEYIERERAEEIFACGKENWKDYEAAACIAALPAADVQPVRHGRWLWRSFNIMCSECDFMPYFDSTEPLYPYCPNCGAKMDGGET